MAQAKQVQATLAAAEQLLEKSRYRAACTAFAALTNAGPNRAAAHVGWGRALAGLGNHEEAATHLLAALDIEPANEDAYEALGYDLLEHVDIVAKLELQLRGVTEPRARLAWARFLGRRKMFNESLAEFARAARHLRTDAGFLLEWSGAYMLAGEPTKALDRCLRAIQSAAAAGTTDLDFTDRLASALRGLEAKATHLQAVQRVIDKVAHPRVRRRWARVLWLLELADKGAAEVEKAVQDDPKDINAWGLWGTLLGAAGARGEALEKFEQCIALDAADPRTYQSLATLLSKSKDVDADVKRIQAAVDKAGSAAAHDEWARALVQLGRADLALRQVEQAMRLSPAALDAEAWREVLSALDARIVDEAIPNVGSEVRRLDSVPAYMAWGNVLSDFGRPEAALEVFHAALRHDPQDPAVLRACATQLAAMGRPGDVITLLVPLLGRRKADDASLLERVVSALPKLPKKDQGPVIDALQAKVAQLDRAELRRRWGLSLAELGERQRAIRELERAAVLAPEDAATHRALAQQLAADGHAALAVGSVARALAAASGDPAGSTELLATFKSAFGRLDSDNALAEVNAAIADIDGAYVCQDWAFALIDLDRPGAGIRLLQKALEKRPRDFLAVGLLGYQMVLAGRVEEGLADCRRAAEAQPSHKGVQQSCALALFQARRYDDALEKFAIADKLGVKTLFDWALALDSRGSRELAIAKYRECIDREGDNKLQVAYCLHNIANLHEGQGDYAVAAKAWNEAIAAYRGAATQPDVDPNLFMYLGSVYADKQDFPTAEETLRRAIERKPSSAPAHAALATLQRKRLEHLILDARNAELAPQYHAQARESYGRARRLLERRLADLETASTYIEQGQLQLAFSEHEEAKASFMKALKLDDDSAEARALLGQACLRLEDLKTALGYAKAAVAMDSQHLEYRSSLAEIHLKLKELDRAEAEYRRILSAAPCHVEALIGLGNTHVAMGTEFQKSGKASDAENMFSQALDHLTLARSLSGMPRGSKRLSPVERAALAYSRGYANVMRYEAQTVTKRDERLLQTALAAFDEVPERDVNYHKAQRAMLKIRERTVLTDRPAQFGAYLIVAAAAVTLIVANVAFLVGKPGLERTQRVDGQSVQQVKAAKAPDDVVARLEALSRRDPLSKSPFEAELKTALGEEWMKKVGDAVRQQATTTLQPALHESIEAGYYALLTFGALLFMIAGLYLQQLSKLKFGGFELEKTSQAETKVIGSLGVSP